MRWMNELVIGIVMCCAWGNPTHASELGEAIADVIQLEIQIAGVNDEDTGFKTMAVSCRFDTSTPPIMLTNALRWRAMESIARVTTGSLESAPVQIGNNDNGLLAEFEDIEVTIADLTYFTVSDRFRLYVVAGGHSMIFDVLRSDARFNPSMTSLPMELNAYRSDPSNPGYSVTVSMPSIVANWPALESDSGVLAYKISAAENPGADECFADINGDGELDFLDISAFLQSYNNGCR